MQSKTRKLFAAALLAGLPSAPSAQGIVDEPVIEEIVVTADFRGRTAREVAASISVLDEERIAASLQHAEELIATVPNLNWSGDGNRTRYLQIRGVGELEQYEGAPNPSVGVVIDDIDFSGIGGVLTLFDLERFEVLRGPQGTRYGANALAGLIYAQSTEPGEAFSLRARASAGGDGLLAGGLAVGGPAGAVDYRLSLHHHESDGFRDNRYLGRDDTNGRRETTARLGLAHEGDVWLLRLAGLYVNLDDGYDAYALDNGFDTLSDRPGRDAQESIGTSLRAERRLGDDWLLTSISSAARSDTVFSFDADWGNPDSWQPFVYDYTSATLRDRETFSQELRLSAAPETGINWTAGVYGLLLDESLVTSNQGVYEDAVAFNFFDSLDEQFSSEFEARNLAVFGQVAWPVGNSGELAIGARLERRSVDYRDSDGLAVSPDESMFGGELSYTHHLDGDRNIYLALSRGYKAGGFNLGAAPPGQRQFDQETLWQLEAGLKSSWLNGRLQMNVALFAARRDDQQVRISTQLNPNDPASFVFFTDNAARGKSSGAEIELDLQLTDTLAISAGLGLLDAEFDRFGDNASLDGREQAHAPGYTAALAVSWKQSAGWYTRAELIARDAFYFDVSHDQRSDAYELVHLTFGYAAETWRVSAWARNAFDETYAVRGFFFGNEPPAFPETLYTRLGDPRQVGITFDYHLKE